MCPLLRFLLLSSSPFIPSSSSSSLSASSSSSSPSSSLLLPLLLSSFLLILPSSRTVTDAAASIDIYFTIEEETPVGTMVFELQKEGRFPKDTSFESGTTEYFDVSTHGEIRVKRRIDREDAQACPKQNFDECTINFVVLVGQSMQVVSVTATISDKNDNPPAWPQRTVLVQVAENSPLRRNVPFQMAKDPDLERNGIVNYQLVTKSSAFEVVTTNAFSPNSPPVPRLVVIGSLDREWQAWHNLTVEAKDGTPPFNRGRAQLTIRVTDENDNVPVFKQNEYKTLVDEDVPTDHTVIQLTAEDQDEGPNAELHYSLAVTAPEQVQRVFRVDERTGEVKVRAPLDYEVESHYEFQVIVRDGGSPMHSATTRVIVKLRDKNDHRPLVNVKPYPNSLTEFQVVENGPNNTIMAAVTVTDKDSEPQNNDVNCSLSPMHDFNLEFLAITGDQKIYRIQSMRTFDRETRERYVVTVSCWDGGQPPLTGFKDIEIRVVDVNDNDPVFRRGSRFTIEVEEENSPGRHIGDAVARDEDAGKNGRLDYSILWPQDQYGPNPLTISGGKILAKRSLDREVNPRGFLFRVVAADQGSPSRSTTATVTLSLLDINDNPPRFSQAVYNFEVKETPGSYHGQSVGAVNASDPDLGRNGDVRYQLVPSYIGHDSPFKIHGNGQIFTQSHIDRETQDSYSIEVIAHDMAEKSERRSATVPVRIRVLDINDNTPQFVHPNGTQFHMRLSYREPPGFRLTTIRASDRDNGANGELAYIIVKGNTYGLFALHKETGDLRLHRPMSETHKETVHLRIRATDHGTPPLFNETDVYIVIDDSEPLGRHGTREGGVFDLETNKVIIICIVIATAIICAVLITAICIMARGTPCPVGFGSSNPCGGGGSDQRPEHVLVRPTPKSPIKCNSTTTHPYRQDMDRYVDAPGPEMRFETFLGPLKSPVRSLQRSHPEEIPDSDGDSGRGGSVKYYGVPDCDRIGNHHPPALFVSVRPDTLLSDVNTSLV